MVEGHAHCVLPSPLSQFPHPFLTNLNYSQNRTFQIAQHSTNRHPQSRHALRPQKMPASSIGFRCNMTIMRTPIDLNRKPSRRAVEIENILPRRMLTTIFETTGPFAQFAPQYRLWQTHLAAQFSRTF